jgi:uncharacterized membrane protein
MAKEIVAIKSRRKSSEETSMKSRILTCITAMTFAVLAIPVGLAAQDATAPSKKVQHHHYKLIDIGTFGGPRSFVGVGNVQVLNNRGIVAGRADTSTTDT